jgi:hypothetical protein
VTATAIEGTAEQGNGQGGQDDHDRALDGGDLCIHLLRGQGRGGSQPLYTAVPFGTSLPVTYAEHD